MSPAYAWTLAAVGMGVGLLAGTVVSRSLPPRGEGIEVIAKTDPTDPEIRKLVQQQEYIASAMAPLDSIGLDSLFADDYRGITAGDQVLDKKVAAAILRSVSGSLVRVLDDSIQVRRYGNVAIMTFRETITARAGGDSIETGRLRITAIWLKRGSSWRVVGSHATVIPSPGS